MTMDRRSFVKLSGFGAVGLAVNACQAPVQVGAPVKPIVIATWRNTRAVAAAYEVLEKGSGIALDAVEAGIRIPEADANDRSVGYGGYPDRTGAVTVDASIMDGEGNCGSVAFLEDIKHPISVARQVMEKTPHVFLVGEGARSFAVENGHELTNMLSPESEEAWKEWLLKQPDYKPFHEPGEQHDTIGLLAIGPDGQLAGGCSTSGMAYKMRGRVGDSPIIGAGLFVDNEVGAATATGTGEEMIRIAGCHMIVERMRMGDTPQQACEEAVARVVRKHGDAARDIMACFLAISNTGEIGAWSTVKGFEYTVAAPERPLEVVKVGWAFEGK